MKKILFLSSFRNLSISSSLYEPFTLLPGINISNSKSLKFEVIDDQIVENIGQIELDYLVNSPNFVLCEFSEEDLQGNDLREFLLVLLIWIKGLFRSAWVLFDHNMDCDAAYLFLYNEDTIVKCSSNFLAQRSIRADCSEEEICLNERDLNRWKRIHHEISAYLYAKESHELRFSMEKGYCRTGRALNFVESARVSLNVGFKIAHYISAFEALFSTSTSELSYRLSERVAFFLAAHGHSKMEVFKNVKAAYDVRSRFVHGTAASDAKIDEMMKLSVCCDKYLRSIVHLLFGEKNLKRKIDVDAKSLDNYFNRLILR